MRIELDKKELGMLKRIVKGGGSIPIMLHAMPVGGNLIATDLDTAVVLAGIVEDADGRTVPIEALGVGANEVDGDTLTLSGVRRKLERMPEEDFPVLPAVPTDGWQAIDLGEAVRRLLPITTSGNARYYLCGIRIEADRAIATDGRMLAVLSDIQGLSEPILLSSTTAGLLDKPELATQADDRIWFGWSNKYVVQRAVNAQFPNYMRVIPKSHNWELAVDGPKLAESLKSFVIKKGQSKVRLELMEDRLKLSSSLVEAELGCFSISGQMPKMTIDPVLLLKALWGKAVTIQGTDCEHPIEVLGENWHAVVMPMRE